MTFEEELKALIERGLSFEDLEREVADLHRRYGREVPAPVSGTITVTEPEDKFG